MVFGQFVPGWSCVIVFAFFFYVGENTQVLALFSTSVPSSLRSFLVGGSDEPSSVGPFPLARDAEAVMLVVVLVLVLVLVVLVVSPEGVADLGTASVLATFRRTRFLFLFFGSGLFSPSTNTKSGRSTLKAISPNNTKNYTHNQR